MNLTNQHAVVTGGATGIGLAVSRMLREAGARVTIMGRNKDRLDHAVAGHQMMSAIAVNISEPESVANAFEKASAIAPISILVNNAGSVATAAFAKMTFEQWQGMVSINLNGTFLTIKAALDDIKKADNGRIINIASTSGLKGYAYTSAYGAAKHGVIGLTKCLALELANTNVTINSICPGFTNTAIVDNAIKAIAQKTDLSEEQALAELKSHNPQNRLIEPDEIAEAVINLCRPESRSITGQSIVIAGGEVM